jgi:hypothetical protein
MKNLAPLWQQVTITKCRMMQDIQMFPAEPEYTSSQHEADLLESTFGMQQNAITSCANTFHELRDSTLRAFMAENFRPCLRKARNDDRQWSFSYLREPFAPNKADSDQDPNSKLPPSYVDLKAPAPSLPESDRGVIHADLSNVVTSQGVDDSQVHSETSPPSSIPPSSSTGDRSIVEDEDLGCRWCNNHGIASGVTLDQRVCTTCRQEQSEETNFSNEAVREMLHDVGTDVTMRSLGNMGLGPPRLIPDEDYGALASVPADALPEGLHRHVLPGANTAIPTRIIPRRDVSANGAAYERALRYGGVLADPEVQHDRSGLGSAREDRFGGGEPAAYEDYTETHSQERPLQQRRRQGASEGEGRRSRRREGRREDGRR